MKGNYCRVLISAPTKEQANQISDSLVSKKLVAGALMTKGESRHWWKEKIDEEEYYNISAFSVLKNKEKIISVVKEISSDDCPIVAFFEMDGNKEFLQWIAKSVETKN